MNFVQCCATIKITLKPQLITNNAQNVAPILYNESKIVNAIVFYECTMFRTIKIIVKEMFITNYAQSVSSSSPHPANQEIENFTIFYEVSTTWYNNPKYSLTIVNNKLHLHRIKIFENVIIFYLEKN